MKIIISENDAGKRLDAFLAEKMEDMTRSRIQKLIEKECITVNSFSAKSNCRIKEGDIVDVVVPEAEDCRIEAEDIPLDVVYEDEDMLVVNKPQGMVVHPAAGNHSGTLVNALMAHCGGNLSGINGEIRPGILHRIDKDTSGLLMVAKNDMAHIGLSEQIKEHSLTREYIALVHGKIKEDSGTIDAPIGRDEKDRKKMTITRKNSRNAVTHFFVLERFEKYTLLRCRLETGRTHQIRVHMSKNGHPIVGDKTYGVKKECFNLEGQLLHAAKIGFIHPRTKEYMEFSTKIPTYYEQVLEKLRRENHGIS